MEGGRAKQCYVQSPIEWYIILTVLIKENYLHKFEIFISTIYKMVDRQIESLKIYHVVKNWLIDTWRLY